ncbi:MAG: PEP-CTERM sorting domain-containing protein [Proteobacteria bacterium]|nr:PEP-CTERM sorting domain-containing protein [Pseudomonadota bacterium]
MMQVAVPEPSSILVIGVGLIGLVATRRKRSRGSIFGASSA